MKSALTLLFFLIIQLSVFGQGNISSISLDSVPSKIIILIIIASVAIYTFIKWNNENKRTDP